PLHLIDTAGLRRKAKVNEDLEFYSVMRSIRAIENSDICILMIDITTGIEAQDMAIFNLIIKNKKGLVVVVNKWDTAVKDSNSVRDYTQSILAKFAPFNDIPLVFASATKKQRILDVMDTAEKVWANYSTKIPTSKLNDAMLPEIENYPPPAWKGKYLKIKFITQLPTPSPSFAFFCNLPQYFRDPYKRFLENKLREHFSLTGCTVTTYMRQK
ncbi:MAG: GTP-binding protein, partial [Bacteroidales bacterium]